MSPQRTLCRHQMRVWLLLLVVAGGCRTSGDELRTLAAQPPLPYRVLLTGGAFVVDPTATGESGDPREGAEVDPLLQTYGPQGEAEGAQNVPATGWREPFQLERLATVLRAGRVFVDVQVDGDSADERSAWLRGAQERGGYRAEDLLERGARGRDLVLVVERLRDGPVERFGINSRWPVTLLLWVSVGLGAVIPDHSYESRATLSVSLVDPYSGRVLYRAVRGSGPVDLALFERTGIWGWIVSILVPPFWVPDDDETVLAGVREVSASRLLLSVAREIKSVEVRQQMADAANLEIEAELLGGSLRVEVDAAEALSLVRVARDGRSLPAASARLLDSLRAGLSTNPQGRLLHRGAVDLPPDASGPVQIIIQTLAGRVRSLTLPDPDRGGGR